MPGTKSKTTREDNVENLKSCSLDFTTLPPVYVLASHLSIDEQHEAEQILSDAGARVTYDVQEARVFFGNVSHPRRARLELRWLGIVVEGEEDTEIECKLSADGNPKGKDRMTKRRLARSDSDTRPCKAQKTDNKSSDTEGGSGNDEYEATEPMSQLSISAQSDASTGYMSDILQEEAHPASSVLDVFDKNHMFVINIAWLNACASTGGPVPVSSFLILKSKMVTATPDDPPLADAVPAVEHLPNLHSKPIQNGSQASRKASSAILERAKGDPKPSASNVRKRFRIEHAANQDLEGKSFVSSTQIEARKGRRSAAVREVRLLHQTTSENEAEPVTVHLDMPDWVLQNKIYSCERSTPADSPNEEFIDLLKKIRLARELTRDEIGVRAYSTSIASLSAFPRRFRSSREILALPGCNEKIAYLWREYKENDGRLQAVDEINSDPALTVLQEFYQIWGVGAVTAREFYYDKGWRDLDDIVEYGWTTLSRVQQIGLKYYDEFLLPIPRQDVEAISAIVTQHAIAVADDRIQCAIVGGYRRGKPESGDVDVILSHPEESVTLNIIDKIVASLEASGWITHTLSLHLTTSHRDQQPLPINTGTPAGHGFDSLDKALVVWQDPTWPTKEEERAKDPKSKNPNPHHRVDIIISPWRTVGCAVSGWTSGTTFQRDLRRYCKHVKGWKFDSSGVRERGSGRWVDLEGWRDVRTRCKTWQEAERKVFEGLGLQWREPWERCTG